MALEPAGEVGALGQAEVVASVPLEVGQSNARATGEDEDGLPDRVDDLALLEGAVLHRRQEMPQPAKRLTREVRVELVPEHEGELAAQSDVADLMQRVGQIRGIAHLREVEGELLDPVAVEGGLGDCLDTE